MEIATAICVYQANAWRPTSRMALPAAVTCSVHRAIATAGLVSIPASRTSFPARTLPSAPAAIATQTTSSAGVRTWDGSAIAWRTFNVCQVSATHPSVLAITLGMASNAFSTLSANQAFASVNALQVTLPPVHHAGLPANARAVFVILAQQYGIISAPRRPIFL